MALGISGQVVDRHTDFDRVMVWSNDSRSVDGMIEKEAAEGCHNVGRDEAFRAVGNEKLVSGGLNDTVGVFKLTVEGGEAGSVEIAVCESAHSEDGLDIPELGVLARLRFNTRG